MEPLDVVKHIGPSAVQSWVLHVMSLILPAFSGHSTKRLVWPGYRANLPVSNMSADSIVVDFNVFKYNTSHFLSRLKSLTMDSLDLQRVEETLSEGIIVTITRAAHAANKAVLCQQNPIIYSAAPSGLGGICRISRFFTHCMQAFDISPAPLSIVRCSRPVSMAWL